MFASGTSTVVVFALALLATTFVGCADERVCPSGSFFDDAAGVCRVWSVCAPGSFVEGRPSETVDRRCQPCADGTFSTVDNVSECQSWGDCAPGQAMVAPGTSVSDRQCLACSPGHFSSGANAAMCSPWTVCPAGSFVQSAGSFVDDQSCAPCPEGTQTLGPNRSRCVAADECAPGSRVVMAGSASTPADCARCNPGEHCPGGNASAEPCGEGHWDHDGDPATACIAQRRCGPGFEVAVSGSAVADHFCRRCAAGHFSAEEHNEACTVWSDCAPGTRLGMAPAATRDQQCLVCEGGWNTEVNAQACTPWSDCAAGTFVAEATTTADRQCAPCAERTYSSGPNWEECLALEHCSASESTIDDGSSTTPVRCGAGWADQFSKGNLPAPGMEPLSDGGVVVFGRRLVDDPAGFFEERSYVRRYDSDGTVLWSWNDRLMRPFLDAMELPGGDLLLLSNRVLQRMTAGGDVLWESDLGVDGEDHTSLHRGADGLVVVLTEGQEYVDDDWRRGEFLLLFDGDGHRLSLEYRTDTDPISNVFDGAVTRGFRAEMWEPVGGGAGWRRFVEKPGRRGSCAASDGSDGFFVFWTSTDGALRADWVRAEGVTRQVLFDRVDLGSLRCAVRGDRHYVALGHDLFLFDYNEARWSFVSERRLPFYPAKLLATGDGYFVQGSTRESRWAPATGTIDTAVMFVED